jgi:hypothetical protein
MIYDKKSFHTVKALSATIRPFKRLINCFQAIQ